MFNLLIIITIICHFWVIGMDHHNSLQRNKFLIRKCCARDQVYNFNLDIDVADRKDRCVKYSITDNLFSSPIENSKQIFFGHEQNLPSGYILENFEVDTGFPRNCTTNMLLEPDKRMADLFYPLASGQLLLPHRFWLIPFENYCIEDFFENENFTKVGIYNPKYCKFIKALIIH